MRLRPAILMFVAMGGLSALVDAPAAITYVDATTANTVLQGGAALVPGVNVTTGPAEGPMDNLWHLRTGLGNGSNGVWTADELNSGSEDVLPLVTTITFPEAGGYQVYVYLWDSDDPGEDWDGRVRLGGAGGLVRVRATEVYSADPAHFTNSVIASEPPLRLVQIPVGFVTVAAGATAQIYIDDDSTIGPLRTWYDGVGYEKVFSALGERLIAIDCNKTNAPGAPSQTMFRLLSGSGTQSQNSTNLAKLVGPYGIYLSKSSPTPFDFRGANGDSTRVIPGGPTSLSCLVADFVGARDGTITVALSNLPAGPYLFRSYHLDTFNSANLGFAQGSSPTTPNTMRAHVDGALQALTQPTAVGPVGLGTNFISDADIPTLTFCFKSDGSNAANINLSSVYTNGADRFILLNGFEVFAATP